MLQFAPLGAILGNLPAMLRFWTAHSIRKLISRGRMNWRTFWTRLPRRSGLWRWRCHILRVLRVFVASNSPPWRSFLSYPDRLHPLCFHLLFVPSIFQYIWMHLDWLPLAQTPLEKR